MRSSDQTTEEIPAPVTRTLAGGIGSGMLSGDQPLPSHRSANSPHALQSKNSPTASQALPDVHETASDLPCHAFGELGNGSSDQPVPFQPSARGMTTGTECMATGS